MKNIDTILEDYQHEFGRGGHGATDIFPLEIEFIRTAFAEYKKGLREAISKRAESRLNLRNPQVWEESISLDSVLELLK